jgi:hypothetical protein
MRTTAIPHIASNSKRLISLSTKASGLNTD